MKSMYNRKKFGEEGFAPIVVSIIIVIVLSLLTLGFVALANNSAKNALTRQLSNDAYYAADSGVNDAIAAITHGYVSAKTTCSPDAANTYLSNNQVKGSQVYYSCLLINPAPGNLQYSSVSSNQPTVTLLSTVNSSGTVVNPTDFVFSWEPSAQVENSPYVFAPNSFINCPVTSNICFPKSSSWLSGGKRITGILRLALTPLNDHGSLPTDTSTTYTTFLYPLNGNGSIQTAPSYSGNTIGYNAGKGVNASCSNSTTQSNACTVDVPVDATYNGYIMSLLSLYTDSRVVIEAFHNGTPLLFRNSQIMIDSTGYDHGVQRRIQVRIASLNYNGFPAYDIASSKSICKDLYAYPSNQTTGNQGFASFTDSINCGSL